MADQRPRLLYIDDDEVLQHLVRRSLDRSGYKVETAKDGASGLARLAEGGFCAVALDHHLPDLTGLQVLKKIVALPNAPPVVYVTADSAGQVAVAALKAGAADYVIKQADAEFPTLLRAAIAAAIEARQLQAERDRAESELRASRDSFARLAEEREVLIREINHRVANNLQLVSAFLRIQANTVATQETKDALAGAMARVEAIGHVHRQLYMSHDVRQVEVVSYLSQLLGELERVAIGDEEVASLSVAGDDSAISTDRAIAIGILVTELVINAFKHAYPAGQRGPVRVISASAAPDILRLTVEDRGRGLPPSGSAPSRGLGQGIVQMMAAKLGARLRSEDAQPGARFVIEVPLAESPEALAGV